MSRPNLGVIAIVLTMWGAPSLHGAAHDTERRPDNVVLLWNDAALKAVRNTRFGPTMAARALAITHTCMYDAWTAYDRSARATTGRSSPKRPAHERTRANRETAVSYAAYRALVDLFPSEEPLFTALMALRGFSVGDASGDPSTATRVGNQACAAVLESRRHDGLNQRGELNGGSPYPDYTGYAPVNTPDLLVDPNRWQPLRNASGATQSFLTPHWGKVTPFALRTPDQFRPPPPSMYPEPRYLDQVDEVRALSASLGDREKVIAEDRADGPASETPPGHWTLFAQYVSRRDRHDLDADVRMFFVLSNALLDASIAVWDCKREFDSIRPVSAVRFVFAGQPILAWAGPYQGTRLLPGERFSSYIATPSFAEYVSGHSAFSAAAATVLRLVTHS